MKAICFAIMKQLWPATRPVPAYDREYLRALRRQRQPQQRKCKFIVIRLLDSDSRVGVNTIYIYIYVCVCVSPPSFYRTRYRVQFLPNRVLKPQSNLRDSDIF